VKYSGSGRPEAADKLYGPIPLYDDEKRVGSAAGAAQKKITCVVAESPACDLTAAYRNAAAGVVPAEGPLVSRVVASAQCNPVDEFLRT